MWVGTFASLPVCSVIFMELRPHRSMSAFPKWSSWEWLISTWPHITSLALPTVSSVPVFLLTSLVIAFPLCSLRVGRNFIFKRKLKLEWIREGLTRPPFLVKELQVVDGCWGEKQFSLGLVPWWFVYVQVVSPTATCMQATLTGLSRINTKQQ